MLGGSYHFTSDHLIAIIRQFERRPTSEIIEDSERPITQRSTAKRVLTDIQSAPLRPRPRPPRAA
jgi:hypothetical protein